MADEDEIDVLGDFSLDNLLSKNENGIYDYDYSNHPQWILEHTTSSNWFPHNNSLFENPIASSSSHVETEPTEPQSPEISNEIPESEIVNTKEWSDKEKILFEQALEVFGRSTSRISQCIGSKSPAQVKQYLKTYVNQPQVQQTSILFDQPSNLDNFEPNLTSEVIVESQIPASIEEVIATVSTAQPTVNPTLTKKPKTSTNLKKSPTKTIKFNKSVTIASIPSGHSILKSNVFKNMKKRVLPETKKVKIKRKRSTSINKIAERENVENKLEDQMQLVTGKGLAVPISSNEEVIKIQKVNEDSDCDVDIDDDSNDPSFKSKSVEKIEEYKVEKSEEITETVTEAIGETVTSEDEKFSSLTNYLEMFDSSVIEALSSLEIPSSERMLDTTVITEEEKCFNYQFFHGQQMKNANRYLKIRSHILNCWEISKPLYVKKTTVRNGLKHCGDVNKISRVHQYLEQIGAINFGCEQVEYVRPLLNLMPNIANDSRKKLIKSQLEPKFNFQIRSDNLRRNKKKLPDDGEGGYTLTHDEKGDIIKTTIGSQKPKLPAKRSPTKLICCRKFTEEIQAPFAVVMNIDVLISMDWHSHSSHSEVMGMLGGTFDDDLKILYIKRYVPCKSATNSATHCDMCPVSQTQAFEQIQDEFLTTVGWFHSHPTFSPNPSQQDLETQENMQEWYGGANNSNPFVGIILSPFSTITNCLISDYRCLIIKRCPERNEIIPYKFNVNLVSDELNVDLLLRNAHRIFEDYKDNNERKSVTKCDFYAPYFLDDTITYLDKMIASTKMHLASCAKVNKMTCDAIIEGLAELTIPY